jgi:DNA-binding transcriptional ArsR family regulator
MNSVSNDIPFHLCLDTLANQLRIGILKELESGPKAVSELATALSAEQSTVSHSLSVLKTCSFVVSETRGKNRMYSLLEPQKIRESDNLFELLEEHAHVLCNDDCKKLHMGVKNK